MAPVLIIAERLGGLPRLGSAAAGIPRDGGFMAALLEVRDLSVEYATKDSTIEAVRHLNLRISGRERSTPWWVRVGPGRRRSRSACWESLALSRQDDGGHDPFGGRGSGVRWMKSRLREIRGASISMIFQDPVAGLNPVVEVGKQVEEVISSHRDVEPSRGARDDAGGAGADAVAGSGADREGVPRGTFGGDVPAGDDCDRDGATAEGVDRG